MLDRVWRLVQHLALVCSVGVAVSWAGSGNPGPAQRGAPSSVSSRSGGSIRNPDQDPSELTTDEIEEMMKARNSDCNFNGIDDSIDVANGQDDDANHDGNIDVCDSDTAFARRVRTDESGASLREVSIRATSKSDSGGSRHTLAFACATRYRKRGRS